MTITLYVVHVYQRGRYVRSMKEPLTRRSAHVLAKTFNAMEADVHGSLDHDRRTHEPPQRAVVEAVEVQVTPPEREPTAEPLGPGVRPTRRKPAVV